MNGAFYIGATGLQAQQRGLEVIGNNVANLNTPGFKRSQIRFAELVSLGSEGLAPKAAAALGGVASAAPSQVFAQGEVRRTGRPMDIAIEGEGFIELAGPQGEALLWRGGTLSIAPDGFLAAADGLLLRQLVSVPAEASGLEIRRDGRIFAQGLAEGDREIGRLELVRVKDEGSLRAAGAGRYSVDDPAALMAVAPGEEGGGAVVQGALEASNVDLADEMVAILLMQRAYGANAQVLQAGDQLMSIANNLRR